VESGWPLHEFSILVEGDASFGGGGIEIGEGPEGFGGLQFGSVEPAPDLIRGGS